MLCLLFTIPVDGKRPRQNRQGKGSLSLIRKIITWFLVSIWLFLISFVFIAAKEPDWLKKLSILGREGESKALVDYGDNFLRQKNYRMAIAQYQKALEIKPDYTGALVNTAIAYSLSGDHNRALQILADAVKKGTAQDGTIYFNMGDILRRRGKYEEAIEHYRKAIDTEVEQDLVFQRLGSLYLEMGQLENARFAFGQSLAIQTDLTTPYIKMLYRSLMFFDEDTINGPILERMLSDSISSGDLKAFDLQTIEVINCTDPEIAKAHNHLGLIYARLGDIDKAIEHFEQSLKIWPGNQDAIKNLRILNEVRSHRQLSETAP